MGCCPKVTKSHDQRDSVRVEYRDQYREKLLRDTTYIRDSILVRDKGDTLYVYRDRYHYVDRFLKDTVRLVDTVFVNIYKDRIEVVEKKYIPQFFWWCFGVALASIIFLLFRLFKR